MCLLQKNYLREKELEEMGRIVNASLDMAESMAMRHIPMTMEDWANRCSIPNNLNMKELRFKR